MTTQSKGVVHVVNGLVFSANSKDLALACKADAHKDMRR
jgi:hypothetical protein